MGIVTSNESHEGPCQANWPDRNCRLQQNCRDHRVEAKECQGSDRFLHGVGRFGIEEEWQVQAWWCAEHEAQEEASHSCAQGRESFHKRALRVQGQAGKQDGSRLANEEVQVDGELSNAFVCWLFLRRLISDSGLVGGLTSLINVHMNLSPFKIGRSFCSFCNLMSYDSSSACSHTYTP